MTLRSPAEEKRRVVVGTGYVSADPSADAGLVRGRALLPTDLSRITQSSS